MLGVADGGKETLQTSVCEKTQINKKKINNSMDSLFPVIFWRFFILMVYLILPVTVLFPPFHNSNWSKLDLPKKTNVVSHNYKKRSWNCEIKILYEVFLKIPTHFLRITRSNSLKVEVSNLVFLVNATRRLILGLAFACVSSACLRSCI